MPRRVPVLAGLVLGLLVGLAAPASAGPWVDRTAGSLRTGSFSAVSTRYVPL